MSQSIYTNTSAQHTCTFPPPNAQIGDFHRSLPHYAATPLVALPRLARQLGVAHVLVKDESSRLGLAAFKILGASWATYQALVTKLQPQLELEAPPGTAMSLGALGALGAAAQRAGVVLYAATDGNHGRAVARMAAYLGISSRIIVPAMVDAEARAKIAGEEGACVEVFAGDYDQTVLYTQAAAAQHEGGKGVLISDTALEARDQVPAWIVEGYQTMFDEMEEQLLERTGARLVSHVVTPVGVGSLAQAVVTHFRRRHGSGAEDQTAVVAVEPAAAACLMRSLERGEMTSVETGYTICTGMCCGTLSVSGWPILRDGVDFAVAVGDHEVHQAIQQLEEDGVLAGPCGAACLAGLLQLASSGVCALDASAVIILMCTEGKRGYSMTRAE